MPLDRLDPLLRADVEQLEREGRAKAPERVIQGHRPARDGRGERWQLRGREGEFLRMNSNSYLSLAHHPAMLEAADEAARSYGVGPGAVRFIDGTFAPHVDLEQRIAAFCGKPAAKVFNSAYTANLGLALAINDRETYWVGDELNHNCIIRAMRIANVPRENKAIYPHNDMEALAKHLEEVPGHIKRVVVIFDGIFSMRGDFAPLAEIEALVRRHHERFEGGVLSVVDDSHGIAAYGATGRGTEEHTGATADVIVGTFGKGFGVNGGFVAGSEALVEAIRQKSDTYIYTNPLGAPDAAAALASVELVDSPEGERRLAQLRERIGQLRGGLAALGLESIEGPHPVVPVMVRDTARTRAWVEGLLEREILAVGLTFPVVPKGDECLRLQVNAGHTGADIEQVLRALGELAAG